MESPHQIEPAAAHFNGTLLQQPPCANGIVLCIYIELKKNLMRLPHSSHCALSGFTSSETCVSKWYAEVALWACISKWYAEVALWKWYCALYLYRIKKTWWAYLIQVIIALYQDLQVAKLVYQNGMQKSLCENGRLLRFVFIVNFYK